MLPNQLFGYDPIALWALPIGCLTAGRRSYSGPLESGFDLKVGKIRANHCAPVSPPSVSLLLAASSPAPA